jgi:hypothetical protein
MRLSRTILFLWLILGGVFAAQAQSWSEVYMGALEAVKNQQWLEARTRFQQAASLRAEDVSSPTQLPGPATERRLWRGGSPYSPNFGAAYCALKAALASRDVEERQSLLNAAAMEFELLIQKGQHSRATYFFLNSTYAAARNTEGQRRVETEFLKIGGKATWRIDLAIIAPEEAAAIDAASGIAPGESRPATRPGEPLRPSELMSPPPARVESTPRPNPQPGTAISPTQPTTWHAPMLPVPPTVGSPPAPNQSMAGALVGRVAPITNKFALIIGNSDTKVAGLEVPFAATDAAIVRDSLVLNAGYLESNTELVQNGTADEIRRASESLAERMPDNAIVFLFFSGVGVHVDGKDYLAGVDTESATDMSTMIAKSALYGPMLAKGARIYAFYQVNRPMNFERPFGVEVPLVGAVAQAQATMAGDNVLSIVRDGQTVGVFVDAMNRTLQSMRSNRIPIVDFVWQIFYAMRQGGTGTIGGASRQTPTLPVLTNMAADSRF